MAAPTADLKATKRVIKDGKISRRSMGFWCQFNCWYRTFWEAEGRRPSVTEVKRWYDEAADSCWGDLKPTWEETRTHSKCLRSLDQVRSYFRQYRAAKKETYEGCRHDSGKPASATSGALQQSLSSAGHPDDIVLDTAFFRAAKLRRPSADSSSTGAQLSGYTGGDINLHSMHSPRSERAALGAVTGATSRAVYPDASVPGGGDMQAIATSAVASEQHQPHSACVLFTSGRTVSTGAPPNGYVQPSAAASERNAAVLTVRDGPAGRYASSSAYHPTTDVKPLPIPVSPAGAVGLWLQHRIDAPPSSSQQQPQPSSSFPTPQQPQGHAYASSTTGHTTVNGGAAPSLPPNILRPPGSADVPLSSSPHQPDRPPRPQSTLTLAQSSQLPVGAPAAVLSIPGSQLPAPAAQPAGRGELGRLGGSTRESGPLAGEVRPAQGGAAPTAPASTGNMLEGQQQQYRSSASGQTPPARPAEMTSGWGKQPPQHPQQMQRVPSASLAAACPSGGVSMSGYHSHHQQQHQHRHAAAHHSVMHVGYDSVYGHPAYMDPYAYPYGMHDPSVAYWRMYPYCYPAPQHPSHVPLYSELPPHIPDYRDPCYGAVVMSAVPLCAPHQHQQHTAGEPMLPQNHGVAPRCAATGSSGGSAPLRNPEASKPASHELTRCQSVPLPSKLDPTALKPPRPGSFSSTALPSAAVASSDMPPRAAPVSVAAAVPTRHLPSVCSAATFGRGDAAQPSSASPDAALPAGENATCEPSVTVPVQQQQQPPPPCRGISRSGPGLVDSTPAGAWRDSSLTRGPASCVAPDGYMPAPLSVSTDSAIGAVSFNMQSDACDVTAVLRVPRQHTFGDAAKSETDIELSPFASGTGFWFDLGSLGGFGFESDSPAFLASGSTPQPVQAAAQAPAQKQSSFPGSRPTGTPAPRRHGVDGLFAAMTPGTTTLPSSLDMLPLPDFLALGSDLDIDCALFLASPSAAAIAAAGCAGSF